MSSIIAPRYASPAHPLHVLLSAYPIACLSGAFLTDIVYWRSEYYLWSFFSIWLITVGVIAGLLAAIVGIVEVVVTKRRRKPAWPHSVGTGLVLLLSIFNAFIHSRDGYNAVVPTGIILSGIVTILVFVTSWMGATLSQDPIVETAK